MTAQPNVEVTPRMNQNAITMASRLTDFTRMNSPTVFGSKVNEDFHDFLYKVYKFLYAMGVS